MRCLVTGAAGFIGSHLCERLIKDGHEVLGIDNLSTGKRSNVDSIKRHQKFTIMNGDIANFGREGIFTPCFDWVFHLAAKADLIPSIQDPHEYHRTNVHGTLALLQLLRLFPAKRFIYAASSSCYGIQENKAIDEAYPLDPQHPYALTKMIGEQYVILWAKVYKVPALSLRLFNVYGPRSRTSGAYGAMFGVFLAQLANDKPLTIVGDGKQKRDFTHVSDVVDAFIKAAQSDVTGEIFNIGTGTPKSVNEIVALLGTKNVIHIPKRPGEPEITWANSTKASQILEWKPRLPFHEGVQSLRMIRDEWKAAPVWDKDSIARATKPWFQALS